MTEEIFSINDFRGGLDLTNAPHLIADNEAVDLRNIIYSEMGSLVKRGGYEKWSANELSGKIWGLFRFHLSTPLWIAIAGGVIYKADDTSKTFTSIASGFQENVWQAEEVLQGNKQYLLLTNGLDRPRKYDGTNLYLLGVDKPTTAPTLTFNATGQIPPGTYYYVVTFIGDNCESSFSPQVSITTTATGSIDLSNIPTSSDPQVTARKIYRSKANDPSVFFYLTTINDNTTTIYHDNTLDSDLGSIPDYEYREPPPTKTIAMVWHKQRLWVVDGNDPTKVYYSHPYNPQEFEPLAYVPIPIAADDEIVGLSQQGDNLVVFCRNSIYLILGSTPSEFIAMRTPAEIGAISPIMEEVGDRVFFLSDNGLYAFNGATCEEVSLKVRRVFQFANKDWLLEAPLLFVPQPTQKLLLLPIGNNPKEAIPTNTLTLELRFGAWCWWDIPITRMEIDEFERLFFFKRGSGYLYRYDPLILTDDGTEISVRYMSKMFAPQSIVPKLVRRIGLQGRLTTGEYVILVIVDSKIAKVYSFSSSFAPAFWDIDGIWNKSRFSRVGPVQYIQAVSPKLYGRYIQVEVIGKTPHYSLMIDEIDIFYRAYPTRVREVNTAV